MNNDKIMHSMETDLGLTPPARGSGWRWRVVPVALHLVPLVVVVETMMATHIVT